MSEAIRTYMLFFFSILIWVLQLNLQTDSEAHRILKESIEIAAHDAALQNIESESARGLIIFHRNEALKVFKNDLMYQLRLQEAGAYTLVPLDDSFFQDPIQIVYEEYIDDSNTPHFPFFYENTTYGIREIIRGPSVVYVVETKTPRYFRGQKKDIQKSVVYEYPYP